MDRGSDSYMKTVRQTKCYDSGGNSVIKDYLEVKANDQNFYEVNIGLAVKN